MKPTKQVPMHDFKHSVYDYETGERLPHEPTPELIRESLATEPTGAVGAYLAGGEWRWLGEGDQAPCGAQDCRTVYVTRESES